jgi:hypothetical protein
MIQRRILYQCVFAGACGHVYGHDALWQMTPHTGAKWMLHSWTPGVKEWTEALDAPGVRSLHLITELLCSHPYLERIPDQAVVLWGQGADVFTRIEAARDGTPANRDATYLMAYLSAPTKVTLDTSVIAAQTLNAYWFDPATGATEVIQARFPNAQSLTLEPRTQGHDWVVVIEDASRKYPLPKSD